MGYNILGLGIGLGLVYLSGLGDLFYAVPCALWWLDFWIDSVEREGRMSKVPLD